MAHNVSSTPAATASSSRARNGKGPAAAAHPADAPPNPVSAPALRPSPESAQIQDDEEFLKCQMRARAFLSTLSDPAFFLRKDGVVIEAHLPAHSEFTLTPRAVV